MLKSGWIVQGAFVLVSLIIPWVVSSKEIPDQNTPAFRCPKNIEGLNFQPPSLTDCTPPDTTQNSTLINITSYWPDATVDFLQAHECYKETYTNVITNWCFVTCQPLLTKQNIIIEPVKLEACKKMKMLHTAPDPEAGPFTELAVGLWGTNNHIVPWSSYLWDRKEININYYMVDIRMTVDPVTRVIKPIGTTPRRQCTVEEQNCTTTRGILMWEMEQHKPCRIMIGKTSPCLRTGHHITCPETFTSIIGWKTVEMCGVKVARATTSGMLFVSEKVGELEDWIGSREEVFQKIHTSIPTRTGGLKVESFPVAHSQQYAGHTQHILTVIEEKLKSSIAAYHTATCRINRMTLEMHLHHASQGDVNSLLMGLTGNPSYRGRMAGDVISIWSCSVVTRYQFLRHTQNDGICSLEHPIIYQQGKNNETFEGWMRPITHEIVDHPTRIGCPAPPFFYKTTDGTLLRLAEEVTEVNVPELPNPGAATHPGTISILAFTPEVIFSEESMLGQDQSYTKSDALEGLIVIDKALIALKEGMAPTEDEFEFLRLLLEYITQGIFAKIFYAIAVVIGIVVLIACLGGMPLTIAILKFIWKFVVALIELVRKFLYFVFVTCLCRLFMFLLSLRYGGMNEKSKFKMTKKSKFCDEAQYSFNDADETYQSDAWRTIPAPGWTYPPYTPTNMNPPYPTGSYQNLTRRAQQVETSHY